MAKYISNYNGFYSYQEIEGDIVTATTGEVRDAFSGYGAFMTFGPADFYDATPTHISGYFYDGSDFDMYGSGLNTNVLTMTKLEIVTTYGWQYTYNGNVTYNDYTGAQSGAINHFSIGSPIGEQVDFYGNFNVSSTATAGTITKITYKNAEVTDVLQGALSYNYLNGTITGNVTSYQFTDNILGHSYTLSNFSIPFSQLSTYSDLSFFVADVMAGDDNIVGTAASEVILGYAGNDTLDGAAGADTLVAGTGNDIYIVDNIGDIVIESSDEGTDLVKVKTTTANGTFALGDNVENATLINTVAYNLTGNNENNILIGNAANNIIVGDFGNDTLDGGLGNDALVGGGGDDTYFVNVATDTVSELSEEGTDTVKSAVTYSLVDTDGVAGSNGGNVENLELTGATAINATGNDLQNILTGNAAANILDGKAGADTMNGGKGADTYIVDNEGDNVTEDFTILQGGGIDLVKSSVSFTLGSNVDNLTLTDGTLTSGTAVINGTGNALNNIIIGNAGDNLLTGNDGIDTLTGNAGNDSLDGGVGNDVMTGGLGDDTLNGGTGNDNMNGGAGSDYYYVDSSLDVVTESLTAAQGGGVDTVESTVTRTLGLNFDHLILTGLLNINGTGNALANELTGNDGNNSLIGGLGDDFLYGGAGTDTLDGGVGNDILVGGDGDDTYFVNVATDTVSELSEEGTDTVKSAVTYSLVDTDGVAGSNGGNVENLTLTGASAINATGNILNNILIGNAAANVIDAGLGNDTLDGGLGNDTMRGGDGDDTYFVNVATDTVSELGGEGTDTVKSAVTYSLIDTDGVAGSNGGNVENLELTGASAINATGNTLNNILTGNAVANVINGLGGDDALNGGAGNDVLIGGIGTDMLTGGLGADRFDFDFITESAEASIDTITDFIRLQLDKIDLSTIDAKTGTPLINDAFTFIGNDVNFSGVEGQLRFDSTTSSIYGDINGDSAADFQIQIMLTGVTSMIASDFIL